MQIDIQDYPFVRMDFSGAGSQSTEETLQIFDDLLKRKQAFVFLAGGADFDKDPRDNAAERRLVALWMKQHKDEVRTYPKAMYYIEASSVKRLAAQAFAVVYGKFWGHPMIVKATEQEALEDARKLLTSAQV